MAHAKDCKKRLHKATEKRLYNDCPNNSADLIIQDCFAGVNVTSFPSLFSYGRIPILGKLSIRLRKY